MRHENHQASSILVLSKKFETILLVISNQIFFFMLTPQFVKSMKNMKKKMHQKDSPQKSLKVTKILDLVDTNSIQLSRPLKV